MKKFGYIKNCRRADREDRSKHWRGRRRGRIPRRIHERARITAIAAEGYITRAKKAIANFQDHRGPPGRRQGHAAQGRMYEFLDRLVTVALACAATSAGIGQKL